jgi:hypothetical protein
MLDIQQKQTFHMKDVGKEDKTEAAATEIMKI